MERAIKMSMQGDEVIEDEVKVDDATEEKLVDVPLIELSEFSTKVKESVEKLIEALLKGVRADKLSLEIDTILALIKVAIVGSPQKSGNYGENQPAIKPLIELSKE